MNKQQKIITSIVGITIVLLALLGITYAYYLTRIEGNTNTNSISITTADLKLVYRENDGIVTAENIMPGTTIEKNFTVTNSGNNKVDNYAVYLEELVNTLSRTEDLTYKLECTSSSGTCKGSEGEFPTLADDIVVNSIDKEVTHTYKLTVTYKNEENIDQSIDMGSKISALVQIYAMKDILDIEGTVVGNEDGDYAQINSVQKRSQIVDGKYKFAGVLPGNHTLKICSKIDTNCDSPKLTKEIVVNLGTEAKVDGNTITITDESQTATININLSTQVETDKVIIETGIGKFNPFSEGTLAYNILNNALNPITSTSTIYSKNPLTQPGKEPSREDERTLSTTEDDYGTSYYFRGNVEDNYVEFNNMCWRIVRIEGDGSVKLILAKQDLCSTITSSDTQTAFIGTTDYAEWGVYEDYVSDEGYLQNELHLWMAENFENKFIDLLKNTKTCIGGGIVYNETYDVLEYDQYGEPVVINHTYLYENYERLLVNKTASLICNNKSLSFDNYNVFPLIADEIILAGATVSNGNNNFYLSDNALGDWWSLSLSSFQEYEGAGYVEYFSFVVATNGKVDEVWYSNGSNNIFARPSISLTSGIQNSSGNGTISAPYVIN